MLQSRTRDAVATIDDQRVELVGLVTKVGQTFVSHLLAVGDIQKVEGRCQVCDVLHHLIVDSIRAA